MPFAAVRAFRLYVPFRIRFSGLASSALKCPPGGPLGASQCAAFFFADVRVAFGSAVFLRHEQVCTCRRLGAFHGPQAHGGGGATASAAGMADECPAAQRIEAMEPRDKRRKFFSAGIGHSPRIGLLFQRLVQPQKALMAAIGGNEAASGISAAACHGLWKMARKQLADLRGGKRQPLLLKSSSKTCSTPKRHWKICLQCLPRLSHGLRI